jgi:sugar transferase (PEP-CTERM/EpsH1 system associated)
MKIAFVSARVPYPPNAGGRIRTYHLLREISQVHRVTLFTGVETAADLRMATELHEVIPELSMRPLQVRPRTGVVRTLVRAGQGVIDPLPYSWAGYRDRAFAAGLRSGLRESYDLVHCDHIQVADMVLDSGARPSVLNLHNIEHMIYLRWADREARAWKRAAIRWQARKAVAAERRMYAVFNHCVAVSDLDRAEVLRAVPTARVSVVPNGVDVDYYRPTPTVVAPGQIVFTGAMDWLPNIDGIAWFGEEVLPLIRQRMPAVRFLVVGRNPAPALVRRLRERGVEFTGTVDDPRPYLAQAALVVVPLRIGGGTRLKILEAWAMGKPVLATTIGAEGLPVTDGENVALADTPDHLAERATTLLSDPQTAERLGTSGRQTAEEQFAWKRVTSRLLQAYEESLGRAG